MLEKIRDISYFFGVDPVWIWIIIGLMIVLVIVKCMYPWKPVAKYKKTKDKDGNEIVTHYHLDI